MAKGDKAFDPIYKAWLKGCKFDSWSEHFKYQLARCLMNVVLTLNFMHTAKGAMKKLSLGSYRSRYFKGVFVGASGTIKAEPTLDCRFGPCSACGIKNLLRGRYCAY